MSKLLLSFFLKELKTVRLICKAKDCGGVVELPAESLINMRDITCPVCKALFDPTHPARSDLSLLGQVIRDVNRMTGCEVEFIIPSESK